MGITHKNMISFVIQMNAELERAFECSLLPQEVRGNSDSIKNNRTILRQASPWQKHYASLPLLLLLLLRAQRTEEEPAKAGCLCPKGGRAQCVKEIEGEVEFWHKCDMRTVLSTQTGKEFNWQFHGPISSTIPL